MVNWSSATELAKDSATFNNLMHALAGLYFWEFVISLDFEWMFLSRKRVFRYPLIFYFVGRYALLFALIGVLVALEVKAEINCQGLYIFNEVMGNASIGLASINLSVRTMAIWCHDPWVVIPLVALILGHWSLLMQGVLLHADWQPGVGCVITETKSRLLAITFAYSMVLDGIVLCLSAWKLLYVVSTVGRTPLMTLVFRDGLIFFVIAFLSNLVATTFMLLNLNPIMSIVFNVPAAIASTVVACRAVRRLMRFASRAQEEFTVEGDGTNLNIAFRRRESVTAISGHGFEHGHAPAVPTCATNPLSVTGLANARVQLDISGFTFLNPEEGTDPYKLSRGGQQTRRSRSRDLERGLRDVEKQKWSPRSEDLEFADEGTVSVSESDPDGKWENAVDDHDGVSARCHSVC